MIGTIGEALVDMIEQADGRFQACLGGSVCNFSLALARQDVPVTYLNPLSVDRFGERFAVRLADSGVRLGAAAASAFPTSLAMVSLDAEGVPAYMFYRDSVADRDISVESVVARLPENLNLLHTGGLALADDADKMFDIIQTAKRAGALISVDANLRPMAVADRRKYFDDVRQAIRLAHVVKVSDEDLQVLGLAGLSMPELADLLFHGTDTELVALTLGPRGAVLLTRSDRVELSAPTGLAVVDTVGAGDCFHAGLIAYLEREKKLAAPTELRHLEHDFLQSVLQHAIANASINIMRSGCEPPTWRETLDFKLSACWRG